MSKIEVTRIIDTNTKDGVSKTSGKPYTVHEFHCEGTVDGVPANPLVLKTLSGKAASTVEQGATLEAERQEYKGFVSYMIATPKPAFGGAGGGGGNKGGGRAWETEKDKYDYKAPGFALSYAKDLVVAGKVEVKDLTKLAQSMLNWLLGAKPGGANGGKSLPPSSAAQPKPQGSPKPTGISTDLSAINAALAEADLTFQTDHIEPDVLERWWEEAGKNKTMFIMRVKGEMNLG